MNRYASVRQTTVGISAMHKPSLPETAVLNLFNLRMSWLQSKALLLDGPLLHEVYH
jgi:hypothetical protein